MKYWIILLLTSIIGLPPLAAKVKINVLQPHGLSETLTIEFTEEEFGKWRRTTESCFDVTGDYAAHFCPINEPYSNLSRCLVLVGKLPERLVPDPSISMKEFLSLIEKKYVNGSNYTWKVISQSENDAIISIKKINKNEEDKQTGDFVAIRYIKSADGFSKIEYAETERLEHYSIEKIQEILSRGRLVAPAQSEAIDIHSGKERNLIGTYFNLHNDKFFTLEFSDNEKWTHSPSMSSWNHSSVCYFPEEQGSGGEIPNRIKLGTQKFTDPEQFSIWTVVDYYIQTYSREADENEYSFSFRLISISKNEVLMSICMKDERSQKEVFSSVVRSVFEGDLLHTIEIKDANPPKNFSKLPYWIELAKNAKISPKADFGNEIKLDHIYKANDFENTVFMPIFLEYDLPEKLLLPLSLTDYRRFQLFHKEYVTEVAAGIHKWIPKGQDLTNWKEMITMSYYTDPRINTSEAEKYFKSQGELKHPGVKTNFEIVHETQEEIVFVVEAPKGHKNTPPFTSIVRHVFTPSGSQIVSYEKRYELLSDSEKEEWIIKLRDAFLIDSKPMLNAALQNKHNHMI